MTDEEIRRDFERMGKILTTPYDSRNDVHKAAQAELSGIVTELTAELYIGVIRALRNFEPASATASGLRGFGGSGVAQSQGGGGTGRQGTL